MSRFSKIFILAILAFFLNNATIRSSNAQNKPFPGIDGTIAAFVMLQLRNENEPIYVLQGVLREHEFLDHMRVNDLTIDPKREVCFPGALSRISALPHLSRGNTRLIDISAYLSASVPSAMRGDIKGAVDIKEKSEWAVKEFDYIQSVERDSDRLKRSKECTVVNKKNQHLHALIRGVYRLSGDVKAEYGLRVNAHLKADSLSAISPILAQFGFSLPNGGIGGGFHTQSMQMVKLPVGTPVAITLFKISPAHLTALEEQFISKGGYVSLSKMIDGSIDNGIFYADDKIREEVRRYKVDDLIKNFWKYFSSENAIEFNPENKAHLSYARSFNLLNFAFLALAL